MKTSLLISFLCLASMSGYAQYQYSTKNLPPLKNDGKRVAVTPAFDQPYTVVSEPAVYVYKRKDGLVVMECPGILFAPEHGTATVAENSSYQTTLDVTGDNTNVRSENTYMGNYPGSTARYIIHTVIPANAVPAYPSTPYTQLQDPPCYQYTTKRGLVVMECHGLRFPPEHHEN